MIEDWSDEVAQIQRRREQAAGLGGPDKIARQHASGRMTVRERIEALADAGSFAEIGALAGFANPDGTVDAGELRGRHGPARRTQGGAGRGRLHRARRLRRRGHPRQAGVLRAARRPAAAAADPPAGRGQRRRQREDGRAGRLHLRAGQPGLGRTSSTTSPPCRWSSAVPGARGRSRRGTGGDVAPVRPGGGPGPAVRRRAARGARRHRRGPDKEQLGGADVHRRNGTVDRFVATEARGVRRGPRGSCPTCRAAFIDLPPVTTCEDAADAGRREPARRRSRATRDARTGSRRSSTPSSTSARCSVTPTTAAPPLPRWPASTATPSGVVATDPYRGDTLSAAGALALTRLVDLCETFHLPIVSLTDQGGMTIGTAAERAAPSGTAPAPSAPSTRPACRRPS